MTPHRTSNNQSTTRMMRLIQSFGIALVAIIIILVRSARQPANPTPSQHTREYIMLDTSTLSGTTYQLVDVVDGDTLRVRSLSDTRNTGRKKNKKHTQLVRLIGIDAPERRPVAKSNHTVECFGKEAHKHLSTLMRNSPTVTIITDPSQGKTDRYDRILGYAIRPSDGLLLNHALILDGVADEYTYRRAYRYQRVFRDAQRTAQAERHGKRSHCKHP